MLVISHCYWTCHVRYDETVQYLTQKVAGNSYGSCSAMNDHQRKMLTLYFKMHIDYASRPVHQNYSIFQSVIFFMADYEVPKFCTNWSQCQTLWFTLLQLHCHVQSFAQVGLFTIFVFVCWTSWHLVIRLWSLIFSELGSNVCRYVNIF